VLAVLAGALAAPVAGGATAAGVAPGAESRAAVQSNATANPCVGRLERAPNGTTVVSVQGIAFDGSGYEKRPSLVVGFGPNGSFEYAYNATARGRFWVYDVDPLPEGELLVTATEPGAAVAETLAPVTGERTSVQRFDRDPAVRVANDIDRLPNGKLLVAVNTPGRERLLVHDPRTGTTDWNWTLAGDGGLPAPDANDTGNGRQLDDADRVAADEYLVSVRALDQVLTVNRSTGAIERRLGADDAGRTLRRPHNPQLLRDPEVGEAVLVADGGNDRVAEYAYTPGAGAAGSPGGANWTLTWELVGGGLNEPRDADRLPNGNTLVVDRRGHRVLEVTPRGRVVWEVYAPWQPYDAERVAPGDEPGGPPATTFDTNRTVPLSNSASFDQGQVDRCAAALLAFAPTAEERLLGAFGVEAEAGGGSTPSGDGSGLRALAFGGLGVVLAVMGALYALGE
jgi:hypothetical protein